MEIFDGLLGTFWGCSFVSDVVNFKKAKREWIDAVNFSEPADKIKAVKNKTVLAGIKASSSFSYLLSWAHEVKWISLGRFMPAVGAFALAGRALLSLSESRNNFNKIQSAHEQTVKISATLEFISSVLCIASYISTLALFVVNAAVVISLNNWLVILSLISLIFRYGYNSFVEKQRTLQQTQPVLNQT